MATSITKISVQGSPCEYIATVELKFEELISRNKHAEISDTTFAYRCWEEEVNDAKADVNPEKELSTKQRKNYGKFIF